VSSAQGTPIGSGAQSEAEGEGELKFRARKKKKLTRAQVKEREVRRRLRHIEWLNSPKGTPHPADTDDEA
jgi:elongation factor 3